MKRMVKALILAIVPAFALSAVSCHTIAAGRNASDVAKLKKVVNELNSNGAKFSTDVETDSAYTWDKDGSLESIEWTVYGIKGDVIIPSFNKLKTVRVSAYESLQGMVVKDNKSLESISCHGENSYNDENGYENYQISKLQINGCTNLKSLNVSCAGKIENSSNGLDLSKYTDLYEINIYSCNLGSIDVSHNRKLTRLDVENSKIKEPDLSNNKKLETLCLDLNDISVLDIRNNPDIRYISLHSTPCTEIYFTTLKDLTDISFSNTNIKKLDLRDAVKLTSLRCPDNMLEDGGLLLGKKPELTRIDCSGNKNLKSLDLSGCTELVRLNCGNCGLTQLDLSQTVNLSNLYCRNNNLEELDTSALPGLKTLNCSNNKLVSLDLSNNKKLSKLLCKGNKITELDLSNCSKLVKKDADYFTFDAKTEIIQ